MLALLNAILNTEGDEADPVSLPVRYAEVNSRQLPLGQLEDILAIGHEPLGDANTLQSDGCASLLATKHVKATAQAMRGTAAHLPKAKRCLIIHSRAPGYFSAGVPSAQGRLTKPAGRLPPYSGQLSVAGTLASYCHTGHRCGAAAARRQHEHY